jgi:hypothetical protein
MGIERWRTSATGPRATFSADRSVGREDGEQTLEAISAAVNWGGIEIKTSTFGPRLSVQSQLKARFS